MNAAAEDQARDELDRLRAENTRLREALERFAARLTGIEAAVCSARAALRGELPPEAN